MASPWISSPSPRRPVERPWTGMALLIAVPVLALILIRMLWSGSSLWFLTVGILLLGAAAVIFLARRPQEYEYDRNAPSHETHRAPLILAGIGVLFLAMLLLPNFAGGGSSVTTTSTDAPADLTSDVAGDVAPPPAQPTAAPAAQPQQPAAGETYTIQSGDTLWDIAQRYGVTVDAIVAENGLTDPSDLQVGQEIKIPAATENAAP